MIRASELASGAPIVTAAWSTALPEHCVRVGISRGVPRGEPRGFKRYKPLYPGSWFASVPEAEYNRLYGEILAALDPHNVVRDLQRIGYGRPIALLCYERPGTGDGPCHRGAVAAWLHRKLGLQVVEYGFDGWGDRHPMLSSLLRQS